MSKKDNTTIIVGTLRKQGKKPTYDNIYHMFHEIITYITNRIYRINGDYRNLADSLTSSKFFSEEELHQMSRIRFTSGHEEDAIKSIVSKITSRIIETIANRRTVNIQVNKDWFKNLPQLRVIHEGIDEKRIYRWNPDQKDTLTKVNISPKNTNEVGDYLNLAEYCLTLQKSITSRYPNPECIFFFRKDGTEYISFNEMIRSLSTRFLSTAVFYGISEEKAASHTESVLCSEKRSKRDNNGLYQGVYVKKSLLEEYLSEYKICISGYDKAEDKPTKTNKHMR